MSNEWYTPAFIIKSAHDVMGGIDLDPASCERANETLTLLGFSHFFPSRCAFTGGHFTLLVQTERRGTLVSLSPSSIWDRTLIPSLRSSLASVVSSRLSMHPVHNPLLANCGRSVRWEHEQVFKAQFDERYSLVGDLYADHQSATLWRE